MRLGDLSTSGASRIYGLGEDDGGNTVRECNYDCARTSDNTVVYVGVGVARVVSDRLQPFHNQPDYIRNPCWWFPLLVIVGWPVLYCSDVRHFYKCFQANHRSRGLRSVREFILVVIFHRYLYRQR